MDNTYIGDKLPEEAHKERYYDPNVRPFLLFFLSMLIVLQLFYILFLVSQLIVHWIDQYLCPLQWVKESDIDQFYDQFHREPTPLDSTDQIIDIIIESIKLIIFWTGLLSVIGAIDNMLGAFLFSLLAIFLLIGGYLSIPIYFARHRVGKRLSDRLINYSDITILVVLLVVALLSITTLVKTGFTFFSHKP